MIARAAALVVALSLASHAAQAQDFASPWAAAEPAIANLLEHALPRSDPGLAIELAGGRWLGLAGLETRAVLLGGGWRSARAAAGLSQTGDAELGWSTAALAGGFAHPAAGAALRAVARHDRTAPAGGRPGLGAEAGGGAWLDAAAGLRLWASAPQLWVDGAAPPLARGFTIGARADGEEIAAWVSRESVRLGSGDGLHASHAAGILWRVGGAWLALEARDRPLRGAFAIGAGAGPIGIAARIESHPVAGETTHLGLRLGAGGGP